MEAKINDAIDVLIAKVQSRAKELADLKRMVNMLARENGREPVFSEAEAESSGEAAPNDLRPDRFYGKSPIQAAREYLEMRGRAVPPEEIVQALERGGFDFEAQGWSEETCVRNLAISLSKNSLIFHRLPNGTYGLVKFYPDVVAEKKQARKSGTPAAEADEDGSSSEAPKATTNKKD